MASCFQLGTLYEAGRNTPQQFDRAARLYRNACDQDHAEACASAARMYERGAGVRRDSTHAVELTRKACSLGHTSACPKRRGA